MNGKNVEGSVRDLIEIRTELCGNRKNTKFSVGVTE